MKNLFETDYVIYDKEKDHVVCFSSDQDIVVYGCKIEAEMDRRDSEEVIKCNDLPIHQKTRLLNQINLKEKNNIMENLIIEKAKEMIKSDFMQYPDYDESISFTFLDAMTVILAQTIEDIDTCEIYDFLQSKFKN